MKGGGLKTGSRGKNVRFKFRAKWSLRACWETKEWIIKDLECWFWFFSIYSASRPSDAFSVWAVCIQGAVRWATVLPDVAVLSDLTAPLEKPLKITLHGIVRFAVDLNNLKMKLWTSKIIHGIKRLIEKGVNSVRMDWASRQEFMVKI